MSDDQYILHGPPEVEVPAVSSYAEHMLKGLETGGNAIAQISNQTGEKVTYLQIRERAIKFALALTKLGIKKGDVVSISSENRFEFTVTAIAVILIGAINAPLNVLYSRDEILHAMGISKPKIVCCSPFTVYNVIDAIEDVKSVQKVILYGDEKLEASALMFEDLIREIKASELASFKPVAVDTKKHPMVILCSSGTTGLPKGVMLTHHNMMLSVAHTEYGRSQRKVQPESLLSLIPWFHAYGFLSHLICLNMNVRCVYMARFEEDAFLSAIQNYKIDMTSLVPPLLVFLAKHPLVDKYDLSSLREIWCGAAPLSKEVQIAVTERLGIKTIRQGYGMTETSLAVLTNDSEEKVVYGSCGTLVPGTMAKVIDLKTKKALGPNQEGELCFKGPLMMLGYLGDAASTENVFDSDGWLHTGDVAYYDEDKYFYIVDRLKELIKYKAYQVPPAEIEALLLQHPSIKDVGVVGLPDEKSGELPLAFVVTQPGAKITEKEIIDFVAKRVSMPKRLHGGVRFVEEIPKNLSGKILRRELRTLLKDAPRSKL